jgi:hypothetical protein
MAPRSLKDAAVATDQELDEIAGAFGIYATAEATTMDRWIVATRADVLQQVQKTRRELQRLEQSLARLEGLVHAQFGREASSFNFDKEYAALEGWSLTLTANYIALVGLGDSRTNDLRYSRVIDYVRGAVQLAATHQPGRAAVFQKRVLDALRDQAVIYG